MPRNDKRFEMAPRYVAEVTSHSVSRAGIIAGRVLNPKGRCYHDAQRGMTWRSGKCAAIFPGAKHICRENTFAIERMACVNFE